MRWRAKRACVHGVGAHLHDPLDRLDVARAELRALVTQPQLAMPPPSPAVEFTALRHRERVRAACGDPLDGHMRERRNWARDGSRALVAVAEHAFPATAARKHHAALAEKQAVQVAGCHLLARLCCAGQSNRLPRGDGLAPLLANAQVADEELALLAHARLASRKHCTILQAHLQHVMPGRRLVGGWR